MFTFYPLDMYPFSVNSFCYTGSHKHIKLGVGTSISLTGQSGYKDVTVRSLGHLTDSVIQGHTKHIK